MKKTKSENKEYASIQIFQNRAQNTDILALQEVNRFTKESLGRLARAYGHPYVALSKEKGYPVALTSRYPIEQPHIIREPMTHGCLIAEIAGYRVVVLHLDPFSCRKRKDELQLVLHTIEHERRLSGKDNWILMGDFNSFSPIDQSAYTDKSGGNPREACWMEGTSTLCARNIRSLSTPSLPADFTPWRVNRSGSDTITST